MLFNNVDDLKAFLLWSKANGIVSIKVDTVEVVFGPDSKVPKEAQGLVDNYWKGLTAPHIDEMSLENPLLFDAVR